MKSSEILREAARMVENGYSGGGRDAIMGALGKHNAMPDYWKVSGFFQRIRPRVSTLYWWPLDDNGPRIIGLCLAAAIAESEGD